MTLRENYTLLVETAGLLLKMEEDENIASIKQSDTTS